MEIPRHWRLKKQRYGLVGEICPHCEAKIFPPRDVCPSCGGEARTAYTFSGRGAFIHLGAMFGTIMVLNVWVHILPMQRAMIAAAQACISTP